MKNTMKTVADEKVVAGQATPARLEISWQAAPAETIAILQAENENPPPLLASLIPNAPPNAALRKAA